MFITYRKTGGVFALITLAAVAIAATVLTIAVAATLLIAAVAIAAAALVVRAVLPAAWRRRRARPPTPWPHATIEATAVNPTAGSSDERDLGRLDSDQG